MKQPQLFFLAFFCIAGQLHAQNIPNRMQQLASDRYAANRPDFAIMHDTFVIGKKDSLFSIAARHRANMKANIARNSGKNVLEMYENSRLASRHQTESYSNLRSSANDDNLLYEVLFQKYADGGFENVSLSNLIYESDDAKYTYEQTIDKQGNILDTISLVFEKIDKETQILQEYKKYRRINGQLVLVNSQKGHFVDEMGISKYLKSYEGFVYNDVNGIYIGMEKWMEYKKEGQPTLEKEINYQSDGSISFGSSTTSEYDNEGNVIFYKYEMHNDNLMQWMTLALRESEYDEYGNLIKNTILEYDLSGSLENSFRFVGEYDANGNQLLIENYQYNEQEETWVIDYQIINTYNANGDQLLQQTIQYENGEIVVGDRYSYTYAANGNRLSFLIEEYDASAKKWRTRYANKETYNSSDLLVENIMVHFNADSSYQGGQRWIYEYNAAKQITMEEYAILDEGAFGNVDRFEFVYTNEQLTESYHKIWEGNTQNWENYLKSIYTYNDAITEIMESVWNETEDAYISYRQIINTGGKDDNDNDRIITQTKSYNGSAYVNTSLDTIAYFKQTTKPLYQRRYTWSESLLAYELQGYQQFSYLPDGKFASIEDYKRGKGGFIRRLEFDAKGREISDILLFTSDTDPDDGIAWNLEEWTTKAYDTKDNLILDQYYEVGYGYKIEYAFADPKSNKKTKTIYYETYSTEYEPWIAWTMVDLYETIYNNSGAILKHTMWNNTQGGERIQYEYSQSGKTIKYEFADTKDLLAEGGINWIIKNEETNTYNAANKILTNTIKEWSQSTSSLRNKTRTTYAYNANGDVSVIDFFIWGEGAWAAVSKELLGYNDSKLLSYQTKSFYDQNVWSLSDSTLYAYNDNFDLTTKTYYEYSQNQIQVGNRWIFGYKSSGFDDYCMLQISGDTITAGNDPVAITAGLQGDTDYEWRNQQGEVLGSANTLEVAASGYYLVSARNDACLVQDSIKIYQWCDLAISGDTIIYHGSQVTLVAKLAGSQHATYHWFNSFKDPILNDDTLVVSDPDFYSVTATEDFCYGQKTIQVVNVTGLGEEVQHLMHIYPNPSTGQFSLQSKALSNFKELEITDLSGRIVKKLNMPSSLGNEMHIDLQGLPKGVYLLNLVSPSQQQAFRLVKE
ncbi:MAG: T9SS type A sorting domain-containing protein [Cyclobacteriaceae bacterium]|nr:T9SS type A sorting domain-containing protein [Cyclobacteriaceae bacterium]